MLYTTWPLMILLLASLPVYAALRAPAVMIHSNSPHSGSKGLVEDVDKLFLEATLILPRADAQNPEEKNLVVEISEDGIFWEKFPMDCTFNLRSCGPPSSYNVARCYCREVAAIVVWPDYHFASYSVEVNTTLTWSLSMHQIRLSWRWGQGHVSSSPLTLPVVCKQAKATIGDGEKVIPASSENETLTLEKYPDPTTIIVFSVSNLVPPYTLAIQLGGHDVATATNRTSVTYTVTDSDEGEVLTLSYRESETAPSCGRSKSCFVVFEEQYSSKYPLRDNTISFGLFGPSDNVNATHNDDFPSDIDIFIMVAAGGIIVLLLVCTIVMTRKKGNTASSTTERSGESGSDESSNENSSSQESSAAESEDTQDSY